MVDYKSFPPIGQNDNFSCWAACLSWWLTANSRQPSTQNDLLVEFNYLASQSDSGTVSADDFMNKIVPTPRFNMQAARFEIDQIAQMRDISGLLPLTLAPNIVVWQKFLPGPGVIGFHMNVCFDQQQNGDTTTVMCMEPWFPENVADGQRTGVFMRKNVPDFLKTSPLIIACAN